MEVVEIPTAAWMVDKTTVASDYDAPDRTDLKISDDIVHTCDQKNETNYDYEEEEEGKKDEKIAAADCKEEEEEEDDETLMKVYESDHESTDSEDYQTEEYRNYSRVVAESRGYDLPDPLPDLRVSLVIFPSYDSEVMEELSKLAIEDYNQKNKTNCKFDSVEKGNMEVELGFICYITFRVTNPEQGGIIQVFQAKLLCGVPDIEVIECHPKPMPNPTAF